MNTIEKYSNSLAISLSLLCAIHCLAFPVLIVLSPSIAVMQLDNGAFHKWLLIAVIPISLYALTLGCKKHKRNQLFTLGVIGLAFLILAVVIGGEVIEKVLTLMGAAIIAFAHLRNYRLCAQHRNHKCSD